MVSEIRTFPMTIPAGTLQSAPVVLPINFPPRVVTAIRWKVPPGPMGLMGWALTIAGNPVIPRQQATYIVADNEYDTWPLEGFPDQGQWQLTGYNTDVYDHTVYLDFLLDQVTTLPAVTLLTPNAALSSPAPAPLDTSGIAAPVLSL